MYIYILGISPMSTISFNVNMCQLNQYDITWTRYGAPWSASLSGGATHQGGL